MDNDIFGGTRRFDIPDIAMPLHARRLRAELLSSPRFVSRTSDGAERFIRFFSTFMTAKRKFALAGASLVLVGVVSFGLADFAGKGVEYAQAQELVEAANVQIALIPTSVRLKIESRLQTTMDSALAEAKASPDLRRISADDLEKETIHQGGNTFHLVNIKPEPLQPSMDAQAGNDTVAFESAWEDPVVTYLVYTDPTGNTIRLGLDKDNVLRVRIAENGGGFPENNLWK